MALTSVGLLDLGQGPGQTTNFAVSYESTLPNQAGVIATANALVSVLENEFVVTIGWFGTDPGKFGPKNRQQVNLNLAGGGNNSGYGTAINVDAQANNSNAADAAARVQMVWMNEWVEILMSLSDGRWNAGNSMGEALSQYCGIVRFQTGHYSYYQSWVQQWLDAHPRQNFIDNTEPTDGNVISFGCGLAFLFYLTTQLGYDIRRVVAAGGPTFADLYAKLTGDHASPYPRFAALLERVYPPNLTVAIGGPVTDDPFPIAAIIRGRTAIHPRSDEGAVSLYAAGLDGRCGRRSGLRGRVRTGRGGSRSGRTPLSVVRRSLRFIRVVMRVRCRCMPLGWMGGCGRRSGLRGRVRTGRGGSRSGRTPLSVVRRSLRFIRVVMRVRCRCMPLGWMGGCGRRSGLRGRVRTGRGGSRSGRTPLSVVRRSLRFIRVVMRVRCRCMPLGWMGGCGRRSGLRGRVRTGRGGSRSGRTPLSVVRRSLRFIRVVMRVRCRCMPLGWMGGCGRRSGLRGRVRTGRGGSRSGRTPLSVVRRSLRFIRVVMRVRCRCMPLGWMGGCGRRSGLRGRVRTGRGGSRSGRTPLSVVRRSLRFIRVVMRVRCRCMPLGWMGGCGRRSGLRGRVRTGRGGSRSGRIAFLTG